VATGRIYNSLDDVLEDTCSIAYIMIDWLIHRVKRQ